jgi:ABC-type nickel/cobalt efflux system permease component RcnA
MSHELVILIATAASVALIHTLIGPDHYLPFIVMAKARNWSILRTSLITFLCGLGHVASSVILGLIGISFGLALASLKLTESYRGQIAAWLLTAFGLVYFVWGLRQALRNKPHTHSHAHARQRTHSHEHGHADEHVHPHISSGKKKLTPWLLFIIFIFGPCEPLIPILMYPAAAGSLWAVLIVAAVFALVTIATMMSVVLVSTFLVGRLPSLGLDRYSHALAGGAIFLCGLAIHLGL